MKKILIIDDQQLVLLSLEKSLSDLGYQVVSANTIADAIDKYDHDNPDLVIVDINMSSDSDEVASNEFLSGLEVVKHIKLVKKDKTPVMVLSGNTDEDIITKGFDLGIDDYMKKPLSLNEISARVKRLIGSNVDAIVNEKSNTKQQFIQNKCIGVVIPCYNEETRISSQEFIDFADQNLGYHLCFVNDGSKDKTLEVLEALRKGKEDYISIYDCEKNGGKAEAVRLGMLHLAKQSQFDYIGFLDADLSTNFDDFQDLADTIYNSKYKLVFGSRISRMGADITKESARAIISKTINFIIRKILGMEINDTQCGAKIMTKEIIEKTLNEKFITKWIFDVEIFMRMKKIYGTKQTQELILEKPLNRWIHADGSKLSMKDSIKIVGQLAQIALHYR
ncbi:glycosyltransferase [Flavobacterium sp. SUN052]|uniref:glycosyltransferase n=1 Tax=Flavobacterium sp. SUN052 TaxID=3002441 RepID=UPI00237E4003|nr:glycosyltransferase [Flavobacterium sp. SUN052]MEC4003983.1 glycosyltransferase [Flavobacterium sp. SUN052]